MIIIPVMKQQQLTFIKGFKKARQILIRLRQVRTVDCFPQNYQLQHQKHKQLPHQQQAKHQQHNNQVHQETNIKNISIEALQNKINEYGQMLQGVASQIQSYEIVMNRLCEYYDGNREIVNRSIELKQHCELIEQQINKYTEMNERSIEQIEEVEVNLRKIQEKIKKGVYQYLKPILSNTDEDLELFEWKRLYRQLQQLKYSKRESKQMKGQSKEPNKESKEYKKEQEIYPDKLHLNFIKIKQQMANRKVQSNAKKMQKKKPQQENILRMMYDDQLNGF